MPTRTADRLAELERSLFRVARTVSGLRPGAVAGDLRIDRAAAAILGRLADLCGVRLSDLAAVLALDISTVSRQVRQLEEAGLVDRHPDPDDRRAARLFLTPKGRHALDGVRAARQDLLARALADWSAADRDRLTDLLTRLATDLGPDHCSQETAR